MEPGTIAQWASASVAVFAIIYTLVSARSRATKETVERIEQRLREAEQHLNQITGDIRHMPKANEVHQIMMSLTRIEGRLETMEERLKPLESITSRMQDYLIAGIGK